MDNIDVQEYMMQGKVLSGQGRYEEALGYYEKAEKLDRMNIEVYLSKGVAYANLERYDEAQKQFENALKVDRTSGLAYYHLGCIALLKGDIAGGFENFNKAVSNGYDDAQVYFSLGLLHEENGEFDLAIRNYSKAISRDAMRADVRIRKARLLIKGNHIPEALQALDETILTNPDLFEGYHLKFMLLLENNQLDKAEETLNAGLALFPKDPGFLFDKSGLLIARGKIDEAVALLDVMEKEEGIEEDTLRRVYMERARISAERDDVDSAITALDKAKAISEKAGEFDEDVIFLLINCHVAKREYEKVLEYSQQLLEKGVDTHNKETARYFEPLALKMLGRTDEAVPKYNEAIREYRKQSLEAPGHLDAYLLRIMCLRDLEQYDKALELIEYVVALLPDRAEPRMLRTSILESLGRNEEAQEEAKKVAEMLPENMRKR
ncbi:MAG: tetratricopeptide repeat protein [Ruminococcaceae bacterium]|nr:tetratricopeptide repeat protein [Oscillospiraceae bacterium]